MAFAQTKWSFQQKVDSVFRLQQIGAQRSCETLQLGLATLRPPENHPRHKIGAEIFKSVQGARFANSHILRLERRSLIAFHKFAAADRADLQQIDAPPCA